jgi:hypothetical protein
MTAKLALLLLKYHVYGLAVNVFHMLQKYSYSYTCRSDFWTANSFPYKGLGGNKKLLPRRFPPVRIVQEFRQAPTQIPTVHPPYGVDSMKCPNLAHGRPSKGVGQRRICWI